MTSVCLCMIVKDEALVIRRCLASVRPILDHWIIVDTGSTDGTQALVREVLAGLPGDLVERPWVDFAHNRSEALALARPHATYSLIIDADDELLLPSGFVLPTLEADAYTIDIEDAGIAYRRTQLVANTLPWRYEGVLHEYLTCEPPHGGDHLAIRMRRNHDGARRRDPLTYARDAAVLEQALADTNDPFSKARYTFYLAQSYRDCGQRERAIEHYLARAELGHWDQEIFVSLYEAGKLMAVLGYPKNAVVRTFSRASETCPSRAEAAHAASRFLRLAEDFVGGAAVAKPALSSEMAADGLFVEPWIYDYGLLDEYAVNAYWAGDYRGSADATLKALERGKIPADEQLRFLRNLRLALDRVTDALPEMPTRGWAPTSPKGGTELMVEALRERLGPALDGVDLRVNLYDPASRDGRPLVLWIHHDTNQAAVQWCREEALVAPVACFVFISHWQRERFIATFFLPPERCTVIRYALDQTSDFRRWNAAPVLRCAYTSTPFRGLDVLLDAWDLIPAGTAELHIWSSMKLYVADDAPYQALFDRARAMPGVVYHGLAPNDELRAALRTMHILAYPSTFAETACLSVMEAMAAGCRVVVPSYGALPETTGGYARVYPWCADPRAHATAFAETLADEIVRPWRGHPEVAIAQQAHCATVFAWSRCLDEWRELIDRLAGHDTAPQVQAADLRPIREKTEDRVERSLRRLRAKGFAPSGLIDVGAHDGSFARVARRVFPEARIVMIDALEEKGPVLERVADELGNSTHRIALLGEEAKEAVPFFVVDTKTRPDLVTTGSSVFRENTPFPTQARALAQETLAEVLEEGRTFQFIKLDVQGAELAVLRGLGERLADIEVILLELSLVAYNDGAPLFAAVAAALGSMGFVLCDVVDEQRYRDGLPLQLDGLFVRAGSALRPQPPFWT